MTGQRPYPNASIPELLRMVIERAPRAPSELGDFGPAVDAVFARGLARDPRVRFTTSWALVDALGLALREGRAIPQPASNAKPPVALSARRTKPSQRPLVARDKAA